MKEETKANRGTALEKPALALGRARYLVPVAAFFVIAVALGIGLTLRPREIPSALIGKPVPEFVLPPVQGRNLGLSTVDLRGQVSLVNVFASWCVPCRAEHPLLMEIARRNVVPIFGLNQRDNPEDAERWLATFGDPYTRTGADLDGRASIEWGVYGVPETFVIDAKGIIAHKHIGQMTAKDVEKTILPMVRRLQREAAAMAGAGEE
ncbi:MAG: DsbE family thiol:disulfide interchange protein [Alphaproteobacteria bacterium]